MQTLRLEARVKGEESPGLMRMARILLSLASGFCLCEVPS